MDPTIEKMVEPLNCIISSFTHHLMIYKEFNLIWAAKYELNFLLTNFIELIMFLMVLEQDVLKVKKVL